MQAVSLALGVLRRSRSSTLCRSPIAQRLADARHYSPLTTALVRSTWPWLEQPLESIITLTLDALPYLERRFPARLTTHHHTNDLLGRLTNRKHAVVSVFTPQQNACFCWRGTCRKRGTCFPGTFPFATTTA